MSEPDRWTIKGRVTTKSDIRHWSNAKGDGKLFSVNFLDETVCFCRLYLIPSLMELMPSDKIGRDSRYRFRGSS